MTVSLFRFISIGAIFLSVLIPILNETYPQLISELITKVMEYFTKPVIIRSTFPVITHHSGLILSPKELKLYDGSDTKKDIYIAILGRVYNVTEGADFYGVGGSYNYFAGRDGSRAFITGDSEDAHENLDNLTYENILDVINWIEFYESSSYSFIGLVSGLFYDSFGRPSDYLLNFNNSYTHALEKKEEEEENKRKFPPCNSEWTVDTGTRFWCTKRSGGIERDWSGVPRKLFSPISRKWRCICLNLSQEVVVRIKAYIEEFTDCSPSSLSCTHTENQ